MGYLLPWGQMSYWGAQVIISLFGAIPVIGADLTEWIRGDYLISGITLNRFFALHVIALPIVLLGLVVLHILALHEVGSNNPDGVDIKKTKDENGVPLDGIPFHPYYTVKDIVGVVVFLFVFCAVVFFFPEMGGYFLEKPNFEEANPLKTLRTSLRSGTSPPSTPSCARAGQAAGRGRHGRRHRRAVRAAVAGPQPGQVHALQGLAEQDLAGGVLHQLRDPGRAGCTGADRRPHPAGADLHRAVFRLLPPDAVLHAHGEDQTRSGKGDWLMKKLFAALMFSVLPLTAMAAGPEVPLDKVDIDLTDKAALQDGLKTFANYCMGCHGAKFQRYERVANDLGIPEEVMMENIVFSDAKIGDHMKIGMQPSDAKVWFGAAPPDLTLVARVRGTDWLYTYLRTFYEDPKRPLGANNVVFPNVGMPNVLSDLQGRQVIGCKQVQVVENGKKVFDPLTGTPVTEEACDQLTIVPGTAKQTEAEFDETVKNLVTFLAYSANPVKLESQRIGTYVLLFLAFFFVVAYLLKREYWKDVH